MNYILRTLKIRPSHKGKAIKPQVADMDGKEYLMCRGWTCLPGEPYAGEEAWVFSDQSLPIAWCASGDLVPLVAPVHPLVGPI